MKTSGNHAETNPVDRYILLHIGKKHNGLNSLRTKSLLQHCCNRYNIRTNVPAAINIPPIIFFASTGSPKIKNAKTMLMMTLNLSIGTTFDASPIWSAL
jgi:hypothetical protein